MGPAERRGLPRAEPREEEQETPLARGAPARGYKALGGGGGHQGVGGQ